MCGIAGGLAPTGISSTIQTGTDALLHRGPDAGAVFHASNGCVSLGHRRLSILDLSDAANQPMRSANGRYTMVYNGEVYNYESLRARLPHFSWRTTSDSEVVLELFSRYGTESFAWLNGMFALAVFDEETGTVILCRDQIGIKPLFYFWDGQVLLFGSELKAILQGLAERNLPTEVNPEAIPLFLHLGFIPEPLTGYKGIQKFPAAHFAAFQPGTTTSHFQAYWRAETHFLKNTGISEPEAEVGYRQVLYEAVRTQMVSDVPLGTFLSGGIDSSLVTAVAADLSGHRKVKTFSIGFKEAAYDESSHAEAVARHLGTDHHPFIVSTDDVLDLVPSLLDVYDEPFADSSAFPTMLVSKLARQHVTVALSGDGGDEIFQGYGMYTWAQRLQNPALRAMRRPLYAASRYMPNRYRRAGTLLDYPDAARLHTHIFSQEQGFFSERELHRLLRTPAKAQFRDVNTLALPAGLGNAAERQAFWDFTHYLKDDLLVKVDRASMRYSLESRVPLLDVALVEFGLSLPYDLKVREGWGTKYLMKKVLYDLVPRPIFERPKWGFAIPLREWLRGPLRHLISDHLSEQTLNAFGYVNPREVSALVRRFEAGEDFLFNRLWTLIVLHQWLSRKT